MTNLTEARLAREAELCYASIALVTDYDCWREATEDVSVEGHHRDPRRERGGGA
jgi:5'-methylthioadenosine phosphorylase